jgi:hypothetical protein
MRKVNKKNGEMTNARLGWMKDETYLLGIPSSNKMQSTSKGAASHQQ